MKDKILEISKLYVISFDISILLLAITYLWDDILIPYIMLLIGILLFAVYCLSLTAAAATTSHSK
jgi:hypothetical protein